MPSRATGRHVAGSLAGRPYRAFIPDPLPPDPPLDLSEQDLVARKERADQALGRLDGITLMLPDPELFLYQYVRKEALLSSQIEGTQATLTDLFDEEAGVKVRNTEDVEEVTNYLRAFRWTQEQLRDPHGLPISDVTLDQGFEQQLGTVIEHGMILMM